MTLRHRARPGIGWRARLLLLGLLWAAAGGAWVQPPGQEQPPGREQVRLFFTWLGEPKDDRTANATTVGLGAFRDREGQLHLVLLQPDERGNEAEGNFAKASSSLKGLLVPEPEAPENKKWLVVSGLRDQLRAKGTEPVQIDAGSYNLVVRRVVTSPNWAVTAEEVESFRSWNQRWADLGGSPLRVLRVFQDGLSRATVVFSQEALVLAPELEAEPWVPAWRIEAAAVALLADMARVEGGEEGSVDLGDPSSPGPCADLAEPFRETLAHPLTSDRGAELRGNLKRSLAGRTAGNLSIRMDGDRLRLQNRGLGAARLGEVELAWEGREPVRHRVQPRALEVEGCGTLDIQVLLGGRPLSAQGLPALKVARLDSPGDWRLSVQAGPGLPRTAKVWWQPGRLVLDFRPGLLDLLPSWATRPETLAVLLRALVLGGLLWMLGRSVWAHRRRVAEIPAAPTAPDHGPAAEPWLFTAEDVRDPVELVQALLGRQEEWYRRLRRGFGRAGLWRLRLGRWRRQLKRAEEWEAVRRGLVRGLNRAVTRGRFLEGYSLTDREAAQLRPETCTLLGNLGLEGPGLRQHNRRLLGDLLAQFVTRAGESGSPVAPPAPPPEPSEAPGPAPPPVHRGEIADGARLRQEIEDLKKQLQEKEQQREEHGKQRQELQATLTKLRVEAEGLRAEKQRLAARVDEKDRLLAREREEHERERQELQATLEKLRVEAEGLRAENERLAVRVDERDRLLAQEREEHEKQRQELQTTVARLDDIQTQKDRLERQCEDLGGKVRALEAAGEDSRKQLQLWQDTLGGLGAHPQAVLERWQGETGWLARLSESVQTFLRDSGGVEAEVRRALAGQDHQALAAAFETVRGAAHRERALARVRSATPGVANLPWLLDVLERLAQDLARVAASPGAALLYGTDLAPDRLGPALQETARVALGRWEETIQRLAEAEAEADGGQGVARSGAELGEFLDWLLDGRRFQSLVNLLRLEQVTAVYCQGAADPRASALHRDTETLRGGCRELGRHLAAVGIRLAPLAFFQAPPAAWRFHENGDGRPLLFESPALQELATDRFRAAAEDLTRTVGDVSTWGFACDDYPDLKSDSRGWLCRGWRTL